MWTEIVNGKRVACPKMVLGNEYVHNTQQGVMVKIHEAISESLEEAKFKVITSIKYPRRIDAIKGYYIWAYFDCMTLGVDAELLSAAELEANGKVFIVRVFRYSAGRCFRVYWHENHSPTKVYMDRSYDLISSSFTDLINEILINFRDYWEEAEYDLD
jgi:hypothetical protein